MSVGNQASKAILDNDLTSLALAFRNDATTGLRLAGQMNNMGLAGLQAAGYSAADAQTALNLVNIMLTYSQLFYGLATQAVAFSFDNGVTPLYAGQ